MPTFSRNWLEGLKPRAERYEERDLGCPGLVIRVNKNGAKVWEVVINAHGRRRRQKLGTFPEVSLAEARRRASEWKGAPMLFAQPMRIAELFEQWAAEVEPTRRSFDDVRSVWAQWGAPLIGNVKLHDLNVHHGRALIDHVSRKSSPNRAAKVVRYISPMLSYAAGRGLLPANPWTGLTLPKGVGSRDRVLRRDEWLAVWAWARAQDYPFGPFVAALMLSAQRLNEVAAMRWDEIDGAVWTLPAARHKSGHVHEVPLPDQLAALIDAQPRTGPHVFSTRAGVALAPGSKLLGRIQRDTGTADWRFHDLRRSAATLMTERGASRFVVERVLGHSDRTVTAAYDRNSYRNEKRAALALLEGAS